MCAAVIVGMTMVLSCSPFTTSWMRFGHPLYPVCTVDESRHPVRNLAWDFDPANDDAHEMGHIGCFVNAYVSPWLARKYYAIKLGRPEFSPRRYIWDKRNWARAAPMEMSARLLVLLSACVLLILPGSRIMGILEVVMLLAFPSRMMGYMRYQPWIFVFEAMALVALTDLLLARLYRQRGWLWAIIGGLSALSTLVWQLSIGMDTAREKRAELKKGIPSSVYIKTYKPARKPLAPGLRCKGYFEPPPGSVNRRNNILLLVRQLGLSSSVRVVGDCLPCDASDYRLTLFGYAVREDGR